MRPYRFYPEARAEAEAAAAFYETKQAGLGGRFVAALDDAVKRVRRNPSIYREMEGGLRQCRLLRFPFGVVFREQGSAIEIVAVIHIRREPGYWKGRT